MRISEEENSIIEYILQIAISSVLFNMFNES